MIASKTTALTKNNAVRNEDIMFVANKILRAAPLKSEERRTQALPGLRLNSRQKFLNS